jgi:diguanylate cyclase (GGDEF)-like protein
VSAWKDIVSRQLHALHFDTIRGKILVFGLLATLVPTLATTLVSYSELKQSLSQQITEQLRGVSAEAARELDQWLDERLHDLRVAASSYEVAENLARIQGSGGGQAIGRLRDHLNSLRGRLPDYEALLVDDARGRVVTSSGGRLSGVQPPPDKLNGLRTAELLLGDPYWDAGLAKAALVLAVPIRQAADGRFLGALAAKVNLRSVTDILQRLAPGDTGGAKDGGGDVYLMTDQGRLIMRSRVSSADLMRAKLPTPTTQALFDREGSAVVYKRADGREVVGTLRRVPLLRWAAVAELPQAEAIRPLARLRSVTTLLLVALLAALGLMAYVLGLLIVRPLERLAGAAAQLVAGDLSVELPVGGGGEVGSLTQSFRTLAGRLREREGQGELERLSVTDALTGLYNRRHLMGTLANEVQRSRRTRRTFSVLLLDADHFKQYNDTHGHLAGDAALVKIAEILRKTTRAVDSVARYGGEEFLVMLLETTLATATTVAERIRARVAAEEFGGGKMTVSVGVAEYPSHGDTPEELIASADAAMYRAKGEGRDRVVAIGAKVESKRPQAQRRRTD